MGSAVLVPHSCRLFLTLPFVLVLVSCSHDVKIKVSRVRLDVVGEANVSDWPLLGTQNNSRRGSMLKSAVAYRLQN